MSNQKLAEELHKPIITKFKKCKVWVVDLAHMKFISKYNKGISFLLCIIDFYRKYALVVPLQDKKAFPFSFRMHFKKS